MIIARFRVMLSLAGVISKGNCGEIPRPTGQKRGAFGMTPYIARCPNALAEDLLLLILCD